MLNQYKEEIESIIQKFNEKQLKRLDVKSLINLSVKLLKFEDDEIKEIMIELKDLLGKMSEEELLDIKTYKKQLVFLKSIISKKYDLYERGSVQALYLGAGLAIGTAVGVFLVSSMSSGMTLGPLLGLVIGISFGYKKEKTLEKADKLY